LDYQLQSNGINTLFITGLAFNTAVYYTVIDALSNFRVFVVTLGNLGFPNDQRVYLESQGVKIITYDQVQASIQIDNSAFESFKIGPEAQMPWSQASFHCLPNRLCNASEVCAYFSNQSSDIQSLIPVGDFSNNWISLDNCSNPYVTESFSNPTPLPYLCCYISSTSSPTPPSIPTIVPNPLPLSNIPNPTPQSSVPNPTPQPITPNPAPQSIVPNPTPQPSIPNPAPQSITPNPTPQPSINPAPQSIVPNPTPQSSTPNPAPQPSTPNPAKPSRVQGQQVDSQDQITRLALIGLLCLISGLVIGLLIGSYISKRRAGGIVMS
jgi:hypothetical protein